MEWYAVVAGRLTDMKAVLALLFFAPIVAQAADGWPGLPPDCWAESRMVHSVQDLGDLWERNTRTTTREGAKPGESELSPNKGYAFVVTGGRPSARITIYAEKDHLVDIDFSELFGLSDVRWVNEKLIFMRPWWSRMAATDLIFDVEQERFVYAETVTDGFLAYEQYLASCPAHGCKCIEKE